MCAHLLTLRAKHVVRPSLTLVWQFKLKQRFCKSSWMRLAPWSLSCRKPGPVSAVVAPRPTTFGPAGAQRQA
eukprot:1449916-Alexandrium_andersonii.AAC.1